MPSVDATATNANASSPKRWALATAELEMVERQRKVDGNWLQTRNARDCKVDGLKDELPSAKGARDNDLGQHAQLEAGGYGGSHGPAYQERD